MASTRPIQCSIDPHQVLRRWPSDRPVVALWSGRLHARWARWTILAQPAGWLSGRADQVICTGSLPEAINCLSESPTAALARAIGSIQLPGQTGNTPCHDDHAPPFSGGWIGSLNYELGALFEPACLPGPIGRDAAGGSQMPLFDLAWCPTALLYDHLREQWWTVGDTASLRDALAHCGHEPLHAPPVRQQPAESMTTPDAYRQLVRQTLELIGSGDIYQANVTRLLSGRFDGSVRQLTHHAQQTSGAWYGAHLELPTGRCIVSMSPELFLEVDGPSRAVVTRPIKGTAGAVTHDADASAEHLRRSAKDAAELNMIIDLMRNDLGRVCEVGSIHVPHGRIIEQHPTICHGVGEVRGRLRADAGLAQLLAATFPAGSITGAPKIRAMQIIEQLEARQRGVYCGSIGYISQCGNACLNVAIRTLTLRGDRPPGRHDLLHDATTAFGVGAGIVADSQPRAEFDETQDKAAVLRQLEQAVAAEISQPLV